MSSDTPVSPTTGKPKPKSAFYDGGCHCGKVEFTVKLSPPLEDQQVSCCNCSICHINGYLMVYPLESQINWKSGKDDLVAYKYGPERIRHHFCPTCGTSIGGQSNDPNFFPDNRAMNVRILRGVDVSKLKLRNVDSRKQTIAGFDYDDTRHPSNPYGQKTA